MKAIGLRRHPMAVENPSTPVADGSGGYTLTWTAASPAQVWAAVETLPGLTETSVASTERAAVTHTVELPYHPEVTTRSRFVLYGRYLYVRGLANEQEANHTLIATCEERA